MINWFKKTIYKILINSGRFTGMDNVYLIKYGSYLIIGDILSMAASFLLSIAFARLLPKETYGQYRYVLSIASLLAISSLSGMNNAVIRGVAKGFDGTFSKGFKAKLKWSILGSVASIAIAIYFWLQNNTGFTISFLIIAALFPFFKSTEIYQSYLSGKKLFNIKATYNILSQFISTIFLIITVFLTKNLIALISVYFLSYTILRLIFLNLASKKYPPNKNDDPETISYGKHLSLMGILGTISQEIDQILLFSILGPIKLAVYSFATLPIEHIQTPFQVIQEIALPKLSAQPKKRLKKACPINSLNQLS